MFFFFLKNNLIISFCLEVLAVPYVSSIDSTRYGLDISYNGMEILANLLILCPQILIAL